MQKGIFIIHPSEIIRKGLNAIVRSYFSVDITLLSDYNDLLSFSYLERHHVVIISYPPVNNQPPGILKLKSKNNLQWIVLEDNAQPELKALNPDFVLSLYASAKEIHNLLEKCLRNHDTGPSDELKSNDLTAREKDVLKLVAYGCTKKEIADQLYISIHTVITHRKHITEKLGIKTISGLTVYAILNNIIDTSQINIENLI